MIPGVTEVGEFEVVKIMPEITEERAFLLFDFPKDEKKIGKLNLEQTMEWYHYQFERNPGKFPTELTTEEFASFFKWNVLLPMKIKRVYFRIKNLEIFKRYKHITEIKPNKYKGPQKI